MPELGRTTFGLTRGINMPSSLSQPSEPIIMSKPLTSKSEPLDELDRNIGYTTIDHYEPSACQLVRRV